VFINPIDENSFFNRTYLVQFLAYRQLLEVLHLADSQHLRWNLPRPALPKAGQEVGVDVSRIKEHW